MVKQYLQAMVTNLSRKGKNGLSGFPDAPDDIKFKIVESYPNSDLYRPVICDERELGPKILAEPSIGQALVFDDTQLHAGAPNEGNSTRVSIELTMITLDAYERQNKIWFGDSD